MSISDRELFLYFLLRLVGGVEGVLQCHKVFAGFERIEKFLFFLELLVGIGGRLDGQADPALAEIYFGGAL